MIIKLTLINRYNNRLWTTVGITKTTMTYEPQLLGVTAIALGCPDLLPSQTRHTLYSSWSCHMPSNVDHSWRQDNMSVGGMCRAVSRCLSRNNGLLSDYSVYMSQLLVPQRFFCLHKRHKLLWRVMSRVASRFGHTKTISTYLNICQNQFDELIMKVIQLRCFCSSGMLWVGY